MFPPMAYQVLDEHSDPLLRLFPRNLTSCIQGNGLLFPELIYHLPQSGNPVLSVCSWQHMTLTVLSPAMWPTAQRQGPPVTPQLLLPCKENGRTWVSSALSTVRYSILGSQGYLPSKPTQCTGRGALLCTLKAPQAFGFSLLRLQVSRASHRHSSTPVSCLSHWSENRQK